MEITSSGVYMANGCLTIIGARNDSHIIWPVWNQIYTSGSTSNGVVSYSNVWPPWNENSAFASNYVNVSYNAQPLSATIAEANKRIAEADDRATGLLLAHLSPDQREQYEKDRCFEVHIADKKSVRRYRITQGWAGNVFLVDEQGKKIKKFCIHPTKSVPYADNLLAQKLLLEADEERFLSIANHLAA